MQGDVAAQPPVVDQAVEEAPLQPPTLDLAAQPPVVHQAAEEALPEPPALVQGDWATETPVVAQAVNEVGVEHEPMAQHEAVEPVLPSVPAMPSSELQVKAPEARALPPVRRPSRSRPASISAKLPAELPMPPDRAETAEVNTASCLAVSPFLADRSQKSRTDTVA